MKRIIKYCLLLLAMLSMSSRAFIYELIVLRRWNASFGRYQYFIGLSDFHNKKHQANQVQLRDLVAILKQTPSHMTKIGSEDISSDGSGNRRKNCGRFVVVSRGGILGGLTSKCRELGLDVQNFEYRFCRVASLGPVLNNLTANLESLASVQATPVSALIQEVESVFSQLASYRDGAFLNVLYGRFVRDIRRKMHQLKLYRYADKTVADYLKTMTTPKGRLPLLKDLLTFDSILLDLQMTHSIINMQNKLNFLAIAGGSHIRRVAQLLTKFGYEPVRRTRPLFVREYNINKCLGGHIVQGKYCRRPKPIDIKAIADFL